MEILNGKGEASIIYNTNNPNTIITTTTSTVIIYSGAKKAVNSESAERSSAHCTMDEGELIVDLGMWNAEGDPKLDLWSDLPSLFPPSSEPSLSPVPTYGPGRASVPEFSPERTAVPTYGPGKASDPPAPTSLVPEFSPVRASVSKIGPERASVPKLGPERAPVPESSPKRACVPESNTERASIPKFNPRRAFAPDCSPESPEAQKCPPTLLLLLPPPLWAPQLTLSPPSVRGEHHRSANLHCRRGWRTPCLRL